MVQPREGDMTADNPPTKRIKIGRDTTPQAKADTSSRRDNDEASAALRNGKRNKSKKRLFVSSNKIERHVSAKKTTSNEKASGRTFSQPSVICSGDRGIFVSSDKGREKNALLELHDLVQQWLEENGINADGHRIQEFNATENLETNVKPNLKANDIAGIEADIASELADLKRDSSKEGETLKSKSIQLITLDIPCVSFLRFPPGTIVDPVDIVHKLCLRAADPKSSQQSRYIKRLTPVSNLAKVLNQGLEKTSEEVLPQVFGPDANANVRSIKFAIRPTIRNNDKLDRNLVIKIVAGRIQIFGMEEHRVDLKHYEKAVLVEVYRGWVGISVVDNTNSAAYSHGFEELKRFNLAEIYASCSKAKHDAESEQGP